MDRDMNKTWTVDGCQDSVYVKSLLITRVINTPLYVLRLQYMLVPTDHTGCRYRPFVVDSV